MTEKDFRKALLRGEGPQPIESAALTEAVLRRDRRRLWGLGILCVVAWMAVVMLPWATILPMLAKVMQHQAETNDRGRQEIEYLQAVKVGTIATFVGSMASMLVAAICTVSLIILSRRATLWQINARLAEISAQLKGLSAQSK